jgi:hypothetical protein
VHAARLVVLEVPLGDDGFDLGLGDNVFQARHAFTFEQAGDAGMPNTGIDVLARDVE